MLNPDKQPALDKQLLGELLPIYRSVGATCVELGIDVKAANRALNQHCEVFGVSLPWTVGPKSFISDTRRILSTPPAPDTPAERCVLELSLDLNSSGHPHWSILNTALLSEASNWSPAAKNAAISILKDSPLSTFETSIFASTSDAERRENSEAVKAWLVYNSLSVAAISRCSVSDLTRDILTLLIRHDVFRAASLNSQHLQGGEFGDAPPLVGLEEMFLKLGSVKPESGAVVSALLGVLRAAARNEITDESTFEFELLDLLPEHNDDYSMNTSLVAHSAQQLRDDFVKNLALARCFQPLLSEPEWSEPLAAVRQLVSEKPHRLKVLAQEGALGRESIALLKETLDPMVEKPLLIFASSVLELASTESAPIGSILEGLRAFLDTGNPAYAWNAGVAACNTEKLSTAVNALGLFRDVVGSERVILVKDCDLDSYLEETKPRSGIVFCPSTVGTDLPSVSVSLARPKEPDEERATEARNVLLSSGGFPPLFYANAIRSVVTRFAAPLLAQMHGGADMNGFVGFKPSKAVELAETHGLVKAIGELDPRLVGALQIIKVIDPDEDEVGDPVGVDHDMLVR